jgi:hypothetical protein
MIRPLEAEECPEIRIDEEVVGATRLGNLIARFFSAGQDLIGGREDEFTSSVNQDHPMIPMERFSQNIGGGLSSDPAAEGQDCFPCNDCLLAKR